MRSCERAPRASHANGARRRSGARESVSGSPRGEAPRIKLANRRDLNRFEVDQRLVVGDGRAELVLLGAGEVALGLEQLERGREADGEALVLGVEALLRELARLARRF